MYIREAHPTDGRQVPANLKDKLLVPQPKTLEERQKVAEQFAEPHTVTCAIDHVKKYAWSEDKVMAHLNLVPADG